MIEKDGKTGYRSFTVVQVSKHGGCKTKRVGGRFINKKPDGAAKKAFTEFCRTKRIRGVCTLFITMKETTRGSAGKEYTYKLRRKKLDEPKIFLEGTDREFVVEYETDIESVDAPRKCKSPGQSRGRPMKRTARKNRMRANNVRRMRTKTRNVHRMKTRSKASKTRSGRRYKSNALN